MYSGRTTPTQRLPFGPEKETELASSSGPPLRQSRSELSAPAELSRRRSTETADTTNRPRRSISPTDRQTTTLFEHRDVPFSIKLRDSGHATLSQDLRLRRLVLSGGGAKGVVYPGAIEALEEQSQLAHIREVGGSSVGALTAAVIAAGMDASGCKTLLDNLNLPLLFSRQEKPDSELTKPSNKGSLHSQFTIARNLGTEAPNLKKLINQATRQAALRRIEAFESPENVDVERIRTKLQDGGNLTFGDLRTLSEHVPGIKKLYCTGTALYSGPGVEGKVPQLAIFSTENDAHKDTEIAEAAVISATLPMIFKERSHALPHDLADDPRTKTSFIDGGLMLVTPAYEMIDPDVPATESLVIALENPELTQARKGKHTVPRGPVDTVLDALIVKTNANNQLFRANYKFVADELIRAPLAQQTVEARLKGITGNTDYSGSKGTFALAMTMQAKQTLQVDLKENVLEHLAGRSGDRTFQSLEHLVFSLKDDDMQLLGAHAGNVQAVQAVVQQTSTLKGSLSAFLATMQGWPDDKSRGAMVSDIRNWMSRVDVALGENHTQRDAFAETMAASNDLSVRRMFDILRDSVVPVDGATDLLSNCMRKDEERTCHRIAQRIRSSFVHPVRERILQMGLNDRVLDQANQDLSQAKTRKDINAALKQLENNYKVAGFKALKELSPVIRKLRTYYIPEQAVGAVSSVRPK